MKSKSNSPSASAYILALLFFFVGSFVSFTQAAPESIQVAEPVRQRREELTEYLENFVIFNTKAFLDRDRTQVSFPFAFNGEPTHLWLGFEPEDVSQRTNILVSHPQLINLTWPVVENESLSLFQREPTYASVEEFLAEPPALDEVRIDSFLKWKYPQFEDAQVTDFDIDMDKTNYILTTYRHWDSDQGVYYFDQIVDASTAKIIDDQIQWHVRAPSLSEGQSYLSGHVQVNYIQY